MNRIIWFRQDLRILDNPALFEGARDANVILLYIYDEDNFKKKIGAASRWFLHQSLKSLAEDLEKKYKVKLILKKGKAIDILKSLIKKHNINSVFWNRVYEPEKIVRDKEIRQVLEEDNIEVQSFKASLLFEPWETKNKSGEFFKVFTPFWKACLSKIGEVGPNSRVLDKIASVNIANDISLKDLNLEPKNPNWAESWYKIWQVNEDFIHKKLDDFISEKATNYKKTRDLPGINGTSKISPYLHFGLISPKQIYHKLTHKFDNAGVQCYLSEVGWREFSYYLLYYFPELNKKNFNQKFDKFPWQDNEEYFNKWCRGKTGIPIIDAGMRELWQTGWMHNRVRMIVASFLTKNLLIDWRKGEEWFWDCLVDADLAANSASWQWVAGSGADASPYFRIFNPILQSQKFDSKGEYIKQYCPEYKDLDEKEIHLPQNPIIDLKKSRDRALEIYKKLK